MVDGPVEQVTQSVFLPDIVVLAEKKTLRLLLAGGLPDPKGEGLTFRSLAGGFLVQSRDNGVCRARSKVVRQAQANRQGACRSRLRLHGGEARQVERHRLCKDGATVGIGAGQMSRVDCRAHGGVEGGRGGGRAGVKQSLDALARWSASDAFFPFADGLQVIAEAGATAVIQPGGSLRDDEVIAAADKAGLAMVFTGMRHFRH